MPTFPKSAIAPTGAIIGASLGCIALLSTPAASCNCLQPIQDAAARLTPAPALYPDVPRGEPVDSYWDVRAKEDRPLYRDGEAPAQPHKWVNGAWVAADSPQPQPPAPAPSPALERTPYPPAPPASSEPLTEGLPPNWRPISYSAINGMTEADYQARRNAIRLQMEGGNQ